MDFMLDSHSGGLGNGKSTRPPCPFVEFERVEVVKEVWIVDMDIFMKLVSQHQAY